jgi:hypothetical protein
LPEQDPLKILGLKSNASPDEIRQAYRDLVRVWHPDRFGTDARLRAKAEEHLKTINAAFHALESSDFRTGTPATGPDTASRSQPQSVPRAPVSRDRILRGWLYVGSILLIAAMGGFAVHAFSTSHTRAGAPAIQQRSAPAERAAAKSSRKAPPRVTREASTGKPDFQVWTLSQTDSDRVQLACSRYTPASESYRQCMKAQLDTLRQSPGAADMTGLSTGEREAAEKACANARTFGSDPAYSRCLHQQIAALAAEPIRPDLSTFTVADRNSIEAACSAESNRGAAGYNRCLIRFAKTLSNAERPAATP